MVLLYADVKGQEGTDEEILTQWARDVNGYRVI